MMRWLITMIWLLGLSSGSLGARVLPVCSDCAYPTVAAALAAAERGDTVLVRPGHYPEHGLLIDKPLTLRGEGFPVLDGGQAGQILTVTADSVTIEGLALRHVGVSHTEDRAGIRVRKARDFRIQGNRLYDTFFGIYLEHSRAGEVWDNEITGLAKEEATSGNAIHAWYCRDLDIRGNQVRGHRDGIYLEFVDSSLIRDNVAEAQLRYGLHFMFSNHDRYTGNTFRDNGAGVAVMFSRHIDMLDNVFAHNWGTASYGLLLKEINDAQILRNTFQSNTIGIFVEGSNRIRYAHNDFARNGWALKVSGGCMDNVVADNNFTANTFDLSQAGRGTDNRYEGNYWSAYTGYDLDRDGRGDVPFRPIKLFSYIVDQTPEAMVLLRSFFVDLLNFAEKVSPVLTPANVQDASPRMVPLVLPSLPAAL